MNRTIIFFIILFTVITAVFLSLGFTKRSSQPSRRNNNVPIPTEIEGTVGKPLESVSPLQKTTIGKTEAKDIESIPGVKKDLLANGNTKYSFASEFALRPNSILTHNGKAIFERIVTPEKPTSLGYALISQLINQYGTPEKIVKGSHHYSYFVSTYIYARKGIAFIGNPHTDEVYEIHAFIPRSTESYSREFGEDLDPTSQPKGEAFPQ